MKDQTKILLCVSEPRGRTEKGWWEAGYDHSTGRGEQTSDFTLAGLGTHWLRGRKTTKDYTVPRKPKEGRGMGMKEGCTQNHVPLKTGKPVLLGIGSNALN